MDREATRRQSCRLSTKLGVRSSSAGSRTACSPTRRRGCATAAKSAKRSFDREVPVSRRPKIKGPNGDRHPPRNYRVASLSFAAKAIEIPRTTDAKTATSPTLRLNII
jgi:hypothetical protein